MKSGKKFLDQLKEIITPEKNYIDAKNLEAEIQKLIQNKAYHELMKNVPGIVGIYNFKEGYYMFISKNFEYELGYGAQELIGKENTAFALNIIFPQHAELWIHHAIPKVLEYWLASGSREEAMKIGYTICIQLQTRQGERKWFQTETDLLGADQNGVPTFSIFYMHNVDAVKKDDLVYYSVKRKLNQGYELLFSSSFPMEDQKNILTKREIEIVKLISEGKTTREIALKFDISTNTIDNHRKNILLKTKANNLNEVMSVMMYKGLI